MIFPDTPLNLLSKLKDPDREALWQVSWKRFLELYHEPLTVITRACYRHHTRGHEPASGFIEDAVANTVADFFSRGQHRYDVAKGRLRAYLRVLVNARVVDLLRKERPLDVCADGMVRDPEQEQDQEPPGESGLESDSFRRALLATLVEDLRERIPLRLFEVFERIKLKSESPALVAKDLGIPRAMIDRNIHKAMTALRELAAQTEYQQEYYP